MRRECLAWNEGDGWRSRSKGGDLARADLVLYFGERGSLEQPDAYEGLRRRYPEAQIAGCSTSGQILDAEVTDAGAVAIALEFAHTKTRLACVELAGVDGSADSGAELGRRLAAPDLRSVFLLSDGVGTNASALIAGLVGVIGRRAAVTGGLAGDGAAFARTLVGGNCAPAERKAMAVGFYGERFRIRHGSDGGWRVFGPARQITRSAGNVLYELDGKPALELYKRYLGEEAERLPGSALLFPLRVWNPGNPEQGVVRTIVGVDEAAHALVFAGDVPAGYEAQLMRGSHENLVGGAAAAALAAAGEGDGEGEVAILISCVGRKLLMGQRVAEETEAVAERLPEASRIGFYSYGELSPHSATGACELHNQTMTITAIGEAV